MSIPRGIRNHNPGNIRHGDKWQGLAQAQNDTDFCTFCSPEHGIRAIAVILLNYQRKHGLRSVREIIARWAPPTENNTEAYAVHVARLLGVDADAPINVADRLPDLLPAIIRHENGQQPYSPAIIQRGISLALEVA